MRIIAFVNRNSGPAYHRLIAPLLLMEGVDVFITNNLLIEHFDKGCDILMYNRILPEHAMAEIKRLQSVHGFKIVVDIDDYWELDEHHVLYATYQEEKFAERQIAHIRGADAIFTTHDRLYSEIAQYNQQVHILPNAIPNAGQFILTRERHHLTRLFWQGSVTHAEDIRILQRPLDGLGPMAGKIKMIMAGYTHGEPAWSDMAMAYTSRLRHQYLLLPGKLVDEYYSAYAHADICLVPLVNSRFNRQKSCLKVLEAAHLGLPVIASDVHPYKDMPVMYARSGGDWIRHIQRLVGSRKRQKEAGLELKQWCDEHYSFKRINEERKQILQYLHKTVIV